MLKCALGTPPKCGPLYIVRRDPGCVASCRRKAPDPGAQGPSPAQRNPGHKTRRYQTSLAKSINLARQFHEEFETRLTTSLPASARPDVTSPQSSHFSLRTSLKVARPRSLVSTWLMRTRPDRGSRTRSRTSRKLLLPQPVVPMTPTFQESSRGGRPKCPHHLRPAYITYKICRLVIIWNVGTGKYVLLGPINMASHRTASFRALERASKQRLTFFSTSRESP